MSSSPVPRLVHCRLSQTSRTCSLDRRARRPIWREVSALANRPHEWKTAALLRIWWYWSEDNKWNVQETGASKCSTFRDGLLRDAKNKLLLLWRDLTCLASRENISITASSCLVFFNLLNNLRYLPSHTSLSYKHLHGSWKNGDRSYSWGDHNVVSPVCSPFCIRSRYA